MKNHQKGTIYVAVLLLVLFFVLSLITQQWTFFLSSLLPIFGVSLIIFFKKDDKKDNVH